VITSAKSIDKSIAVTFCERIGIGIVDTLTKSIGIDIGDATGKYR